mmetsp:Transcript_7265/g.17715  ORF Transcript_7265/g.17715 Transcript_7265/m.17715 type:complete len:109 (+) Transcript_7265:234-560(+)
MFHFEPRKKRIESDRTKKGSSGESSSNLTKEDAFGLHSMLLSDRHPALIVETIRVEDDTAGQSRRDAPAVAQSISKQFIPTSSSLVVVFHFEGTDIGWRLTFWLTIRY